MSTLLSVDRIEKHFAGVTALAGVSLEVDRRSITSVIGPNGSGKTSLMNVITGFYPADAGAVALSGKRLTGLPPHRVARCGVARTFQHIRLFKELSVFDNVLVGAEQSSRSSARVRTQDILRQAELAELNDLRADQLSYGHQRRLEIARAVAAQPKLLILDEPAAGMNPTEKAGLERYLRALRDDGLTLLLVEHDMGLVMGISDAIVALNFGRVIAAGSPSAVRHAPAVIEAYLGTSQ